MKSLFFLLLTCLFNLVLSQNECIIFEDEFTTFDLDVWQHEITLSGGGNWEFQYYINNRTNSYVDDGRLILNPTLTEETIGLDNLRFGELSLWGSANPNYCTSNSDFGCQRQGFYPQGSILNPIQSARVRTINSFAFKYGRVEISAKLPKGDWIWPALWLMPRHNAYGEWPASGEIDIMESRGNGVDYPPGGVNQVGGTLHWGPFYPEDPYEKTTGIYKLEHGDFSESFHTFGLYWDKDRMYTYVDDDSNIVLDIPISESFWKLGGWENRGLSNPWKYGEENAPFDQQYYLIFNVAVGGTNGYFPDGYGKPWTNNSPMAPNEFYEAKDDWEKTWKNGSPQLEIDFVKVWGFEGETSVFYGNDAAKKSNYCDN
eukprot:TRINITY_DN5847_c2_g1_i1.p1 TRINITY_DN5847_c2_g1~~TRINITY_DN5847_c2_g1_i1.p1  ORF type:complete len:372 (+),score=142.58 TRINITY_DN5847_c2_g1_i1:54-1169(+)